MSHTVVLTDVPPGDVDRVIAEFEAEGATASKALQTDGNYTVTAIVPDAVKAAKALAHPEATVKHAVLAWKGKGKHRKST